MPVRYLPDVPRDISTEGSGGSTVAERERLVSEL